MAPTLKVNTILRRIGGVVLILLLVLTACSKKDDARQVREVIRRCAEAAEQKHITELLEAASQDFIAHPGGYNVRSVKGVLFALLRQYGVFEIHYPLPTVQIAPDGKEAAATVYFVIVRRDRSIPGLKALYEDPQSWLEAVGEKAELYQLALDWVKADGNWLVRRAHLERFRGISG
jgi:hypothetical protein